MERRLGSLTDSWVAALNRLHERVEAVEGGLTGVGPTAQTARHGQQHGTHGASDDGGGRGLRD